MSIQTLLDHPQYALWAPVFLGFLKVVFSIARCFFNWAKKHLQNRQNELKARFANNLVPARYSKLITALYAAKYEDGYFLLEIKRALKACYAGQHMGRRETKAYVDAFRTEIIRSRRHKIKYGYC